ncbi:MAG: hypothetical protein DWQ37_07820 [Planctomycetota bacterium]|nr:MAG: hypothetical protein DWQ37_07820 [Planctomycetota bacterium]
MAAIGLSFVNRWPACVLYVLVALMWLVPDRRIERAFGRSHDTQVFPWRSAKSTSTFPTARWTPL